MTRMGYKYGKILIDASRVLDSQFNDAVLSVTGAQLELLRNMTGYLAENSTYVDAYYTGYYETPSDEDFATILAIVADLELELMGNMNTPFGYTDIYQEYEYDLDSEAGIVSLDFSVVPTGEVWVVTQLSARNEYTQNTNINLIVRTPIDLIIVASQHPDAVNRVVGTSVNVILKPTQYIQVQYEACSVDDVLWAYVAGYKMTLPT